MFLVLDEFSKGYVSVFFFVFFYIIDCLDNVGEYIIF